jgi:hypothetical protein
MKKLFLLLGILTLATSPVLAGKNANGTMAVHTDDAHGWTDDICGNFDAWVPDDCICLGTRTDKDENTPALIWFIAFFPMGSAPGVSTVYFGHEHNLPADHHNHYGFCGPAGTLEVPDSGWPDAPETAGTAVAFGSPIVDDHLFPFYCVDVYGFSGAYYCTAINPVGGYAAFADDSYPPVIDECEYFGCVRWYEDSYNECPLGSAWGACCLPDGTCEVWSLDMCMSQGYAYMGHCTLCDPNPCVNSSVPEISVEPTTWGRIKSTYQE